MAFCCQTWVKISDKNCISSVLMLWSVKESLHGVGPSREENVFCRDFFEKVQSRRGGHRLT